MKRIALSLILASGLLAQVASAQSSTPVVGYYKVNVLPGNGSGSAWVSGFVTKKDFQGAATSIAPGVTTSQINVAGTPLAPPYSLHYVEILSGANAGTILDIDPAGSNTTSHVTVKGNVAGLGLLGTETFCIRKHATFGSIFKSAAGLVEFVDLIVVQNSDGTSTAAYWDMTNWINTDDSSIADNEIVYPGQGVSILPAEARLVTFGGGDVSYVKLGQTKVPVYASPALNYIGTINPLVNTVAPTALDSTATGNYGLKNMEAYLDLAVTYTRDGNFASLASYYTDNTDVFDAGLNVVDNTTTIFNGTAIEVVPQGDHLVTLPQSFTVAP